MVYTGCVINMAERVEHNELLNKHICAREYVRRIVATINIGIRNKKIFNANIIRRECMA